MFVLKERGKLEYPEKNLSEQSREPTNSYKLLNKQGPLDKQQRREAGSFVDQDQQYF